jgi:hypothetical protein
MSSFETPTGKREPIDELVGCCEGLGISPPTKKNGRYRDFGEIVHSIAEDGFTYYLNHGGHYTAALLFLYGREFFADDDTRRKTEVGAILSSKNDPNGPFHRLMKVVNCSGDSALGETDDDDLFVSVWTGLVHDWAMQDGASTIFHDRNVKLVFRKQPSRNCFVHAPAVLHGYLVQQSTGTYKGMLDITRYVRHCFDSESLSSLIVHDKGGCSLSVFEDLLTDKDYIAMRPLTLIHAKRVAEMFKEMGAALVSLFQVEATFAGYAHSPNEEIMQIPSFEGTFTDEPQPDALHAMILVGTCYSGEHWFFLLQNWWSEMQFVEVRDDYLITSKAKIIFASYKQTKICDDYPTTMATYAEAHVEGRDGRPRFLEGRN